MEDIFKKIERANNKIQYENPVTIENIVRKVSTDDIFFYICDIA